MFLRSGRPYDVVPYVCTVVEFVTTGTTGLLELYFVVVSSVMRFVIIGFEVEVSPPFEVAVLKSIFVDVIEGFVPLCVNIMTGLVVFGTGMYS